MLPYPPDVIFSRCARTALILSVPFESMVSSRVLQAKIVLLP